MQRAFGAFALVAALTLAACSGGSDSDRISLPDPAPGPVPNLPVDAAAADSPLPEVTVRRLNGDGGFVQLKNHLPSDRPLLVWFWAPH